MFERKVYTQLLEWKQKYSKNYAVLLEGARRVGKSTIAKIFAEKEYKTYIFLDFSIVGQNIKDLFDNLDNMDFFFLMLQAYSNVTLYERESVIIFDEVQLFPKARQAIKHLVNDGRYDYIETGSLISIKKNIKNILIPSEEMKISVYPLDYEEFLNATKLGDYTILEQIYKTNKSMGDAVNRKLMQSFRLYMAIGGMPQAVEAYINKKTFEEIDLIKKEIIALYMDDFKRIDASGRVAAIYNSIPAQLSSHKTRYSLSSALNKKITKKDEELLYELIDSKTVLMCNNVTEPSIALSLTKRFDSYKLYLSDIGLFTTMIFGKETNSENIYMRIMSNKLDVNLGYVYENVIAQMIKASGRELYFHTWNKINSTHNYEIDFLITKNSKVVPIEVKSGIVKTYHSLNAFCEKYSKIVGERYIISQKDISNNEIIKICPFYLFQCIIK